MRARMVAELKRLREVYGEVDHAEMGGEDWFKIVSYQLPEGWLVDRDRSAAVSIIFSIKADYPGGSPYGFLAPAGFNFEGTSPENAGEPPGSVPFEGDWVFFSWHCEDWPAGDESERRPNLVSWSRSFVSRLREGA